MRIVMLALVMAALQSTPVSLWPNSATPANPEVNDTGAVELGVKFRSDVDGSVLGIRFYKGTTNTGTHIGNLWTAAGANLATVPFTGETASGWQHMNFANPVPITANTTYVASYYCPMGHYAGDGGYFATAYNNAPLHALQDGAQGGNGVYLYGVASAFPNQTYQSSNYWVDIVFSPAATTTPPTTPPPTTTPPPASSGPRSADTVSNDHCGCGSVGPSFGGTALLALAAAAVFLAARVGRG
jgi:hypothetical protein